MEAKVWQIVVNLHTNYLCVLTVLWDTLRELLTEGRNRRDEKIFHGLFLALFVALSAGPAMSADITQAELMQAAIELGRVFKTKSRKAGVSTLTT